VPAYWALAWAFVVHAIVAVLRLARRRQRGATATPSGVKAARGDAAPQSHSIGCGFVR
jgi:hypothetical protein